MSWGSWSRDVGVLAVRSLEWASVLIPEVSEPSWKLRVPSEQWICREVPSLDGYKAYNVVFKCLVSCSNMTS